MVRLDSIWLINIKNEQRPIKKSTIMLGNGKEESMVLYTKDFIFMIFKNQCKVIWHEGRNMQLLKSIEIETKTQSYLTSFEVIIPFLHELHPFSTNKFERRNLSQNLCPKCILSNANSYIELKKHSWLYYANSKMLALAFASFIRLAPKLFLR